jgi:hypothetical protein
MRSRFSVNYQLIENNIVSKKQNIDNEITHQI